MVDFEDLTAEQRAAADALDRNVALTAGAGTGKTTTLTARYLRMLERGIEGDAPGDADAPLLPEEIVTTTFTERAANELRASVREAVTERAAASDPDEYAAWRAVADGLEDGYVHTLHGFCSRLLREHALHVDAVDPGFETLDETETAALLEGTVSTLLETHDGHEAVRTLARRYSRSALETILVNLLTERPGGIEWAERWADATREEYLEYVGTELHPVPPDLATERLADPAFVDSVTTLRDLLDSPPDAVDTGGRAWERAAGVLDRFEDVDRLGEVDRAENDPPPTAVTRERFLDLCDHLTTGDGERYSSYAGAKGRWSGAEAKKETFDDAMATVVDVLEPEAHLLGASLEADANGFPFVRALARLTRLAHGAYTERKRRRNVVDFTDQVEFAVEFLTEDAPPELLADLRERFAYVMVDEFQDTDPRQWELVAHLTATDPEAFDARNVFVVGDAKQSIYRFRNADVTAFRATAAELAAANPGEGTVGDDDRLSTNFRTLPGVLRFVNALFDEVFETDGEPYEVEPQPLSPFREDPADLANVEYLAVPTDPEYRASRFEGDPLATARPEHDAELEAMALAARLTRLFEGPARVYDEDDTGVRALEPDDVAVLLRSRTHLKRYERAFDNAAVPYTVASGVGFYDSPEVTALVNLFRALADPSDERALYGALRSPLFGVTDDALATLKRDGEPLWEALSSAEADELRDANDLLSGWRGDLGVAPGPGSSQVPGRSWSAFLDRVIDETGYLAGVAADERPRQAVANVEKFREQLRGHDEEGVTGLRTLVRRIERRRSVGAREGEATVRGGGDGVRVLTVHDAKGMEFPVVVVPGVGHGFNTRAAVGDGRVEFEEVDGAYAAGLRAPDPEDPFETTTTVAREALRERRTAEERAEEKRILYVACTRARDRLLLVGRHDLDADGEPSMTDAEPAAPESASSWRDWVQPHLLDEGTLEALDERDRVTGRLGDARFTVSLPQPSAERTDEAAVPEPESELSAPPPRPDRRFALSPTDLASLFDGHGSLHLDERTNTVRFEGASDREDATEGRGTATGARDRDGDGDANESMDGDANESMDGDANENRGEDRDGDGSERLPATVFGEAVHRLCELRPPLERRAAVVEQVLAAEGVEWGLEAAERDRVLEHAERAMAYVDRLHADHEVERTYDELSVTAEFDHGEVSGFVDHLVVTPDAYHVVDYKTNDVDVDEVEATARYYRPQLAAYAVALGRGDPDRGVTATLYFTALDEPYRFEWPPEALEELGTGLEADVLSAADSLEE